jgi:hypothetical protein
METITIKQPAGIGDIFYCLKIAFICTAKGYKVERPVIKEFSYIKDYIKYPNLEFTDFSEGCYIDKRVIDLQDANIILPEYRDDVMRAKYKLVEADAGDWLDFFKFFRNKDREELLYNHLNPNNEEYILRSQNVGSPPNSLTKPISIETDLKIIDINFLPEYNLFDWCKILENASEIYMVDTSFRYIMERLDMKASSFKLYSRWTPANFSVVGHIPQNVKWQFMEW